MLALPQAIAAGLCLMAAGFMWPLRRESAPAAWLLVVLGCAILWAFAGALEFMAVAIPAKIFWTQVSYVGIMLGPVGLFHFAYAYTRGTMPPRWLSLVLFVIGVTILLSPATNAWHGLHWTEVKPVQRGEFVFALYERGPMFWATVVYCYGFMFTSSVMLAAHTITLGHIFRLQAGVVIFATLAPWATSLTYVMRIGPLPELDHTPVGFAITGMLLSWAVLRMRLFEVVPVAANTLFAHLPDPVLVTDPAGRLVRANAAALERFGPIDRHIGQPLIPSLASHPELAGAVLESGEHAGPRTFSLGAHWWTIESSSLDERDGRPRGRLIVLRDITEQKRAEIAVNQAKQELETTLARVDALAKDALAASTAKSTFLAQVSHDLRTPLHAIIGMTEVLRAGSLSPGQLAEVNTISDAGDALLRLINDLLDLSRIEAGRIELVREPFQLDDVLDQVADLLGPAAHRKGLRYLYWIDETLPGGLRGDAGRLRQMLFNLVGNAVKFTDHGDIALRAGRVGDLLRIEVSDTGLGIAEEHLPALFDPFNRGDPEVARRIEGTGLGLAITRRVAEAMGGSVGVRSRLGEGTVFTLELPIIDDEATSPGIDRLRARLSGLRVVVAMRDPQRRDAVVTGLRGLGANAFAATEEFPSPGSAQAMVIGAPRAGEAFVRAWIEAGATAVVIAEPEARPTGKTVPLRRRSLAAALVESSGASSAPSIAQAAPRRLVLLADDNDLSRRVSAAQLAQCNCEVESVNGGLPALERLAEKAYDIIVLDGQMPDLNGWEVAFRLRQKRGDALNLRTPIVALTADLTPESHIRWLNSGAAVVLGKPVRTRELAETIERFTPRD